MPTPSIQTLRADAQQVLNLDSISAVRSVVAATLANANAGTPLNPNLTTQQLWNEFYQIVTQPKSDIESIIANQLMKFLFAPPAPGGAGADKQVIFNDGGVLAGDPQFLWNKTTNLLTVTGSATITGDLTVDTSTLKVDSANNRVGIGTASPVATLQSAGTFTVSGGSSASSANGLHQYFDTGTNTAFISAFHAGVDNRDLVYDAKSHGWRLAAGTAMTLNSTGLGVGGSPSSRLDVANSGTPVVFSMTLTGAQRWQQIIDTSVGNWTLRDQTGSKDVLIATAGTGNVGIGVVPSAWYTTSGYRALQIGNASLYGRNSTNSEAYLSANVYENASANPTYITSSFASRYTQDNGVHKWFTAPSGTAGNAITFTQAMTLDESGRLILLASTTTPATLATNGQLTFTATSNTNLRFSYRGSDGVTRTADLTLA